MKERRRKTVDRRRRTEDGVCEDCEHSVPAGDKSGRILTCRQKAGTPGRLWVVEAQDHCPNFTKDKELLEPELVQALAEGARLIPLTQDKFAIVDAEDYDRLREYKWYAKNGGNTYYAARAERVFKDGKFIGVRQILMHRFIMNAPRRLVVDHINHNGLDNRRENLRLCTRLQNSRNRLPSRGGTSKYKGVTRSKRRKKFMAEIRVNQKKQYLGYFDSEIEAAKAYDKKAKELFGEFAYLNFPDLATD